MRASELYKDLKKICKNAAFGGFSQAVEPPYIVYLQDIEQSGGDYKKQITRNNYVIELYTERRDMKLEAAIEKLLQGYAVDYSAQYGEPIAEEGLILTAFYFSSTDK